MQFNSYSETYNGNLYSIPYIKKNNFVPVYDRLTQIPLKVRSNNYKH